MNEWLTAGKIAKLELPDMPHDPKAVRRFMEKQKANDYPHLCRPREGKGGGYSYHYSMLSPEAIVAYDARENGLEISGQSKVIFSAKRQRERAFINAMHYRFPDFDSGDLWKLYDKSFGRPNSKVEMPREAEFKKYCNVLFAGETTFEQNLYSLIANDISKYTKPISVIF